MVAPDIQSKQDELFTDLDNLAANLSTSSLQFGWKANELWNLVQEDFMAQSDGKEKKALTAFIDLVQQREGHLMDGRKVVADRFRIGKYIPESMYNDICSASVDASGKKIEPTYHQIRACVMTAKFGELDEAKTSAMVNWCIGNSWPSVVDIRIQRGIIDPKLKVDPAERHYKVFVKLAQTIMLEKPEGSPAWLSAKNVVDTWSASPKA